MLKTLSRLPPTRSSCLATTTSAANGALRRPQIFQLQYKHLTTLCYASIIATAAALDARSKQRRRSQWDTAIADARRSLSTVANEKDMEREHTQLEQEEQADYDPDEEAYVADSYEDADFADYEPAERPSVLERLDDPETAEDLRREIKHSMVAWPVREDGRFERLAPEIVESSRVPRQSIYADAYRRNKFRKVWSPKKLATVELSIAKLTTQFALEPYSGISKQGRKTRSFLDLAGFLDESMRAGHLRALEDINAKQLSLSECDPYDLRNYKHVRYPQYSPASGSAAADGQSWRLNNSLIALLGDYDRGLRGFQETLTRVSYELMMSEYAPEVRTYTILINRFSRLGQHNIVGHVISSFYESTIRPNELLAPSIILHYSRMNNKEAFEHFLEKTQGQHRGMMLAKPTLSMGVADKAGRVIRTGKKIIQKMQFDPIAYQTIIATYLRFDDVKAAAKWHQMMRKERIDADLSLMVAFLKYDIKHFDWNRIVAIWGGIRRKWLTPTNMPDLDHVDWALARTAFHDILHACKRQGEYKRWRLIYAEALSHGFSLDEVLLARDEAAIDDDLAEANQMRNYRKILERRLEVIIKDFKSFEIIATAAKMILHDFPMHAISALFERHRSSQQGLYAQWKEGRPWLDDYVPMYHDGPRTRHLDLPGTESINRRVAIKRLRLSQDGPSLERADLRGRSSHARASKKP